MSVPWHRPCRLVVGDALGRYQQCGDGIDQRGFARANVARQEAISAIKVEGPDAFVEGAPVEDFQALQAKAGQDLLRLTPALSPALSRARERE